MAAEAGTSPVLPVRPPGPIPILVMQPNGTDVACAYEVKLADTDDGLLKNKKSTTADSDAGDGEIGKHIHPVVVHIIEYYNIEYSYIYI